eukprot:g831.t1
MINEVMLLGFISLILTLVEESIAKICVHKSAYDKHWIPVEHIDDCDSCFNHTRRLSDEFDWKHRCEVHKYGHSSDYDHHDKDHDSHYHEMHQRRLLGGSYGESTCGEDEVQFISPKALHEVHICIFLIAVTHVLVVAIMVVIATCRLELWKRWKREDDHKTHKVDKNSWKVVFEEDRREIPSTAQVYSSNATPLLRTVTERSLENGTVHEEDEEEKNIAIVTGFLDMVTSGNIDRGQVEGEEEGQRQVLTECRTLFKLPSRIYTRVPSSVPVGGPSSVPEGFILPDSLNVDERPAIELPCTREDWLNACWKQFYRPINRDEFRILRCSFIMEHRRPDHFNFETHIMKSLDDDIGEVVKIPIIGWIAITVGYVVWTPAKFSVWPFLIIVLAIEITVYVICSKLVTIVLLVTKNNQLHQLNESVFWRKNPKLLLKMIKVVLFVNSIIFSYYLYVAWQYGLESCVLVGKVSSDFGLVTKISRPLLAIVNVVLFLHISWIMLPLYSVIVHMSSTHFSQHLLNEDIRDALHNLVNRARKNKEI